MNLLRIAVQGFRNDFHSLVPSKGGVCIYTVRLAFLLRIFEGLEVLPILVGLRCFEDCLICFVLTVKVNGVHRNSQV